VIGPSQKTLRDITQHLQETNIYAFGGIQTHNPSKQVAADPRRTPRGHWDRQLHRLIHRVYTYLLEICFEILKLKGGSLLSRLNRSPGFISFTPFVILALPFKLRYPSRQNGFTLTSEKT
jgi:hypothetical protein